MRLSTAKSEIFSTRLIALRKHIGLTQKAIAQRLNVSKNYIYMIENGRPPGPKFVEQVRLLEESIQENEQLSRTVDQPQIQIKEGYCRYPESCDLPKRLSVMEGELKAIRTQMDTLMALLGNALHGGLQRKQNTG